MPIPSPTVTEQQTEQVIASIADTLGNVPRSPVLHTPADAGLHYEDVVFPSLDGTPLEGWFVPAEGADRLVVVNHPMTFTRSGLPTHLEPWRTIWGASGNDIEVNFVPDIALLHEAGFHVLAYDLRNHGLSGAANGGVASSGIFEARDVVGSLRYVASRPDLRDMPIGLFSRCLGCNATLYAMSRWPEAFGAVRCLVGPQPVTEEVILGRSLAVAGVPLDRLGDLEERLRLRTSIGFAPRVPAVWARDVRVPTFLYQVRDDLLTTPEDTQAIFDAIPVRDKALHWIEDTTRRWDGYLEFQRRPEPMLAWFGRWVA
jgi:pimeloyl-ACP methyl ester carboxylesterase